MPKKDSAIELSKQMPVRPAELRNPSRLRTLAYSADM
jgi:hypothetical protein